MNEYEETPLERRKNQKELLTLGAGSTTVIGFIILACFVYNFFTSFSAAEKGFFGVLGDFVGGFIGTLFSATGIFLLYLTLKEQRENFEKERLENNFFEMIKFHKENVSELEFTYHENNENNSKVKAVRRKVFKVIFSHFDSLWMELDFLFKNATEKEIYHEIELEKIKKNNTINERTIDLKQIARIDIVYLIIFFGLSKSDRKTIQSLTFQIYNEAFINKILDFASLKPKRNSQYWVRWKRINDITDETLKEKVIIDFFKTRNDTYVFNRDTFLYFNNQLNSSYYDDIYDKYYGGHQFRLGHYYRHLFQNLKYINDQLYFDYNEKYAYIKLLRVQLSNYEQIMLFLNSLSQIGRQLEISQYEVNDQLITKYNLITNIPNKTLFESIDIINYYPLVEFETINNDLNKKVKIKKTYK